MMVDMLYVLLAFSGYILVFIFFLINTRNKMQAHKSRQKYVYFKQDKQLMQAIEIACSHFRDGQCKLSKITNSIR